MTPEWSGPRCWRHKQAAEGSAKGGRQQRGHHGRRYPRGPAPAVSVALLTLWLNVWFDGPVALLDELYLGPTLRGQGRGTALLHEAEQVTRERSGAVLEINVDGDDAGARRLYERHGYRNSEPASDEQLLLLTGDRPS